MLGWIRRVKALLSIVPDVKRLIELWKGDEQGSIRKQAMQAMKSDPEVKEFITVLDDVVDRVGDLL